ncbi:MAG: hypothetical protein DRI46_08120 [Chloroflexi bacterium]|nr:MAG: hypothetical protein DRI46_08120 [Chloroflexota bacterium]
MAKKHDGTKTCKACGITKPIERFYTNGKSWRAVCKRCMAVSRRESGNGKNGNGNNSPTQEIVSTREKVLEGGGNPLPHMAKVVKQGSAAGGCDDSGIVDVQLFVLPKTLITIGDTVDQAAACDTCGSYDILTSVYARQRRIHCCNDCCYGLTDGRMLIAFKGYKLIAIYPVMEKEMRL